MSNFTIKTGQRVERVGIYEDMYGYKIPLRRYRDTVPPHPFRRGDIFFGRWISPLPERRQQVLNFKIKKMPEASSNIFLSKQ